MRKLIGITVFVALGGLLGGCGTSPTPAPEVLGTTHVAVLFPAAIEHRMG